MTAAMDYPILALLVMALVCIAGIIDAFDIFQGRNK